jgi:hypothetical protein
VNAFNKAVRENAHDALPHVYLARMAREVGNLTLASQELQLALEPRLLLLDEPFSLLDALTRKGQLRARAPLLRSRRASRSQRQDVARVSRMHAHAAQSGVGGDNVSESRRSRTVEQLHTGCADRGEWGVSAVIGFRLEFHPSIATRSNDEIRVYYPSSTICRAVVTIPPLSFAFDPTSVVRSKLSNGLTVLIRRDRSAPVVAIVTFVSAGYFDETDDIIGIAHVLEHMYFKGTPTRGVGEIAKQTKAVGGYLNAGTIYDTSYYTVLPASGFAQARRAGGRLCAFSHRRRRAGA